MYTAMFYGTHLKCSFLLHVFYQTSGRACTFTLMWVMVLQLHGAFTLDQNV